MRALYRFLFASVVAASVVVFHDGGAPAAADVDQVSARAVGAEVAPDGAVPDGLGPIPSVAEGAAEPNDSFGPSTRTENSVVRIGVVATGSLAVAVEGHGVAGEDHLGFAEARAEVDAIRLFGAVLLASVAKTTCRADGDGARGATELVDATFLGAPLPRFPAPNTRIGVTPAYDVVLNEQYEYVREAPGTTTIHVNAINVRALSPSNNVVNVIVGQVECEARGPDVLAPAVATPTIVTNATPSAPLSVPISSTATLRDGSNPTGTMTFAAYGPADPACSGPPAFTSTVPVAGDGDYNTGFVPPVEGAYRWVASYSGDSGNAPVRTACFDPRAISTVVPALVAQMATHATRTAGVGLPIADTATVSPGGSGPGNAPDPTGVVQFSLFDDPTCSGAAVFTSAGRPLSGTPPVATSDPYVPTVAGTYYWIATYSGDANYPPVAGACGDPGETSTVHAGPFAQVVTQATSAAVGAPISDTATVTGGGPPAPGGNAPDPTGTVRFSLFDNAACSGAPVFTSSDRPISGTPPTTTSDPFIPTGRGHFYWVATYSGDANYPPAAGACGEPGEVSTVGRFAQVATQATASTNFGAPVSDTATVTLRSGGDMPAGGAPEPTGTIRFSLFDNAACSGAPVFTSGERRLAGTPPTATSDPFVPSGPGPYYWIASYGGDANFWPAASTCGDPGETTIVLFPPPTIAHDATGELTIGPIGLGQVVVLDPDGTTSCQVNCTISDTVTVNPAVDAPPPMGTVQFTVFDNPTCGGEPLFTSVSPLSGSPPMAWSGPYTPTRLGTYYWIATYSGDEYYFPEATACGAPGSTTVVKGLGSGAPVRPTPSGGPGVGAPQRPTPLGPGRGPAPAPPSGNTPPAPSPGPGGGAQTGTGGGSTPTPTQPPGIFAPPAPPTPAAAAGAGQPTSPGATPTAATGQPIGSGDGAGPTGAGGQVSGGGQLTGGGEPTGAVPDAGQPTGAVPDAGQPTGAVPDAGGQVSGGGQGTGGGSPAAPAAGAPTGSTTTPTDAPPTSSRSPTQAAAPPPVAPRAAAPKSDGFPIAALVGSGVVLLVVAAVLIGRRRKRSRSDR